MAEVVLLPPVGQAVLIDIVREISGRQVKAEKIFRLTDVRRGKVLRWIGSFSPRIRARIAHGNKPVIKGLHDSLQLSEVDQCEMVGLGVTRQPRVNKTLHNCAGSSRQPLIKFRRGRLCEILQLPLINRGVIVGSCKRVNNSTCVPPRWCGRKGEQWKNSSN